MSEPTKNVVPIREITPHEKFIQTLFAHAEGMIWLQEKPTDLPGDRFCLQSVVVNLTGVGNSGRTMQWKPGSSTDPTRWVLTDPNQAIDIKAWNGSP